MLNKSLLKLTLWTGLLYFGLFWLVLTAFLFFFGNTGESYSFTQKWAEYYSLEDWNISAHAITDIDQDGKNDIVTFTNCAFLSSVSVGMIPVEKRCEAPGMSGLVFMDDSVTVGQKLISKKPFVYDWLLKSYLTKSKDGVWKFYNMNGLQLRTFVMDKNLMFNESVPTYRDRIDVLTYQISHLGMMMFFIVFGLFMR